MLVDSHCHLTFPNLKEDLSGALQRAREQGVGLFLLANTTLEEIPVLAALSAAHAPIYRTAGVHPVFLSEASDLSHLSENLSQAATGEKVVGIGEIGLDYHEQGTSGTPLPNKLRQQEAFRIQLEVARTQSLPVCVHTRDAQEDTLALLSSFPGLRGVIHCFSGSKAFARAILDLGFYLSFSGVLTFPKATTLQEIARFVPADRMLIETDAPFLAPIPHRGKSNEPAWVVYVARQLASLREESLEDIARQTTENFFTLFSHVPRETENAV
ncbi:MAG: TatD family hydrolase [Holosporales bacterium]|jgi:TatD DNase family protein|nr:TatD family hydrolase [Holosporales bacterium]